MRKFIGILWAFTLLPVMVNAQRVLSLDSCRTMALNNNKQMGIARVKQSVAHQVKKSARTKYLPHITAMGSYLFTSREISILNASQKSMLSQIGSTAISGLSSTVENLGVTLTPEQKSALDGALAEYGTSTGQLVSDLSDKVGQTASVMNAEGQKVVDAFRTDTRNIWAGSIMLTQPVFMGGSLVAINRLADLGEEMEHNVMDATRQQTLYDIDRAYWTVVSLKHKKRLADSFLSLVKRLDSDVQKMIAEGVATRSDGLSVSVKVNEAEMTVTQVDDGLVLARMLLCQLCGLPLEEQVQLEDEDTESLVLIPSVEGLDTQVALAQRPELRLMQNVIDMSKQSTNLLRAGNLPQVALMGGYAVSNPNVYDGFRKRFGGVWNVGVLVRIPVWNWGDVTYKVRAAKGATTIAEMEMEEAREKIELQVNQSAFRVTEAQKKLSMAMANTYRAEENLRCADLGFKEGVIQLSTVMEAQTAWLQAQSQKIDAEIDIRLSQVEMQKALGSL